MIQHHLISQRIVFLCRILLVKGRELPWKIIVFRAKTLLVLSVYNRCSVKLRSTPPVQSVFSAELMEITSHLFGYRRRKKKVCHRNKLCLGWQRYPLMFPCLAEQEVNATFSCWEKWAEKYPVFCPRPSLKAVREIRQSFYSHRDPDGLSQSGNFKWGSPNHNRAFKGLRPNSCSLRPPSGSYNDAVIDCIHQSGCIPIQWSIDTGLEGALAQEIADRVSDKTFSRQGLSRSMPVPNDSASALPSHPSANQKSGIRNRPCSW